METEKNFNIDDKPEGKKIVEKTGIKEKYPDIDSLMFNNADANRSANRKKYYETKNKLKL